MVVKHRLRLEGKSCAKLAKCVQNEDVVAVNDSYATFSSVSSGCSSFASGVLQLRFL